MITMSGREVLLALGNGASPSDYQWRNTPAQPWVDVNYEMSLNLMLSDSIAFRATPIALNGFEVPPPLRESPDIDEPIFIADPTQDSFVIAANWDNSITDSMWLERGLVYRRRDDAVAAAKAMAGINPAASS